MKVTAFKYDKGSFVYETGVEALSSMISVLMNTPRGSRVHDPLYGSFIEHYRYLPYDTHLISLINTDLRDSLSYIDDLEITGVSIVNEGRHLSITVQVMYEGSEVDLSTVFLEGAYYDTV